MIFTTKSLKEAFTKVEKIKGDTLGYSIKNINNKPYLVKSFSDSECRALLVILDEYTNDISLNKSTLKTLTLVKEAEINIDVENLEARTNKRKIKLPKLDIINPIGEVQIGTVEECISIKIEEYKLLMQTVNFAAKDETRPILKTVNFNSSEVCSTDAYQVCIRKGNFKLKGEYNIPASILKDTLKLVNKDIDNITISFTNKYAIISIDDIDIIVKLHEGSYIRYKSLINSDYKTQIDINLKELIEESKFLNETDSDNIIKLTLDDDSLLLSDKCEITTVNIENYTKQGEPITIAMNSNYLLNALKCFDDESVKIRTLSPTSLITVKSKNINGINLIFPVRLLRA